MNESVFIETAKSHFGDSSFVWRDVEEMCKKHGFSFPETNEMFLPYKYSRGKYNMNTYRDVPENEAPRRFNYKSNASTPAKKVEKPKTNKSTIEMPMSPLKTEDKTSLGVISTEGAEACFIPKKDENYVGFGIASNIRKVLKSRRFLPVFIAGDTGEGKTYIVQQVAARMNKEVIRVNCTPETDESDLIGDFRLVDGCTVFQKGPVLEAMERGAILLLDEVDSLDPERGCFCLYSVLEGSGAYVKKIATRIEHADGFTVIATANTKGKGSMDGRYIGTNILNEAFLDRFDLVMVHDNPTPAIAKSIMKNNSEDVNEDVEAFIENLITWSTAIRNSMKEGVIQDSISTRRLVKIIKLYEIFNDRLEVIRMTIQRFSEETVESFIDLYEKIDENPDEYKKNANVEFDDSNEGWDSHESDTTNNVAGPSPF